MYPQQRDSGVYECQISTTPPVGYSMMLSVVEPITTIIGGPDLYIDTGSTVNLTCIVRHLPEPPPLIQWTHNGEGYPSIEVLFRVVPRETANETNRPGLY
uniref:Ig-like domain-containing protein n=1 Tax=Anopheles stephensi TaxID=30069 RepID=A0A182YDS1_ANOST